MNKFFLTGEE